MKFKDTNKMKEGSRQYLDQQGRILFGQAQGYKVPEIPEHRPSDMIDTSIISVDKQ